ncbi:MAG: hypothetical protein Q9204_006731 [Flavoplaca sp. TL-2023a]
MSAMDVLHGLSTHYPCFSHESHAGYLPEMAAFDYSGWIGPGQNPSRQDLEAKEVLDLRSKLAIAESRIDELQKEKAVTKNVIDYLLKQSGSANLYEGSPYTPQHANYSRAAEEVKGILNPIIGLLHDIVRAAPLHQNSVTQSVPHADFGSGTLIDLLSDESEPGDSGKGPSDFRKPSSTPLDLAQATKPPEISPSGATGKAQAKQAHAPESNLMFSEKNITFTAPLVTRFGTRRDERTSRQDTSVNPPLNVFAPFQCCHEASSQLTIVKPAAHIHEKNLGNLQRSFDESETGLSVSTQYDASQSNSASSVSTMSSVQNSDDEDDQAVGNILEKLSFDPRPIVTISGPSDIYNASKDLDHKESRNALETITPPNLRTPVLTHAAKFMPKWPTGSFAVSAAEREAAIFVHQRNVSNQENRFPDVFKYGIRFRPDPMETDLYRTLVVTGLPFKVTMSALLQQIQGAAVVDAKLLDTASIDGHSTALITFVHECNAKAIEQKARETPWEFFGKPVVVTLLPTPTWPMPGNLRKAIVDHRHTRCLEVHDFPRAIKPAELEYDLRIHRGMTSNRIEAKTMRLDGVLELRFNSVNYAGQAYGTLTTSKRYKQCQVKRVADPCTSPLNDSVIQFHRPTEVASSIDKEPKDEPVEEAPNVATNGGVTCWKEYAFETFTGNESRAGARMGTAETPEDNTCRLSEAGVDGAATIRRGRGFATEQSVAKTEETCNQQ